MWGRSYDPADCFRICLSIYLVFLYFGSLVEADGRFPYLSSHAAASANSLSKLLLLSLEDRNVRLAKVHDASDQFSEDPRNFTAQPFPIDGIPKVTRIQQRTLQLFFPASKRSSRTSILSFPKRENKKNSLSFVRTFSTLQFVLKEMQTNSLAVLYENQIILWPLASMQKLIEERRHFHTGHRKLMSDTSIPAVESKPSEGHTKSNSSTGSETDPSLPMEGSAVPCDLDLLDLNFGGVQEACGAHEDNSSSRRRRCCPVLDAWLYYAHAKTALLAPAALHESFEVPVLPDDSDVCYTSLQSSLQDRNIHLSAPNASCDFIACFCGIRLHQIESLSCPARPRNGTFLNFTQTPMFRSMEANCSDSSYSGCTNCLATLEAPLTSSLQIEAVTREASAAADCRMTGLLWLLATNRTLYLPTVSAVLRATLYPDSASNFNCSLDKEDMPQAYDNPSPATSQAHLEIQLRFLVLLCALIVLHYLYI